MAENVRQRIPLDTQFMTPFEQLCKALALLVMADIITVRQARSMLADYGMEPRDASET